MKKLKLLLLLLIPVLMQAQTRWEIQDDGSILWNIQKGDSHYDHIEMSGEQVSTVIRYGINPDGSFQLNRSMIWPMLRTVPNKTHNSLMQRFGIDYPSILMVNGLSLSNESVKSMSLDGRLTVVSEFCSGYVNSGSARMQTPIPVVEITRAYFPSTDKPMFCERYTVKNITDKPMSIIVPAQKTIYNTEPEKGVDGSYTMMAAIQNDGRHIVQANESITFDASVQAYKSDQREIKPNIANEEQARKAFVGEVWTKLNFKSPDPVLNTAFAFAKIRASESIYRTKNGLMHGPGGESYYAAIWANDQAEYVNPFFPFLGYKTATNQPSIHLCTLPDL